MSQCATLRAACHFVCCASLFVCLCVVSMCRLATGAQRGYAVPHAARRPGHTPAAGLPVNQHGGAHGPAVQVRPDAPASPSPSTCVLSYLRPETEPLLLAADYQAHHNHHYCLSLAHPSFRAHYQHILSAMSCLLQNLGIEHKHVPSTGVAAKLPQGGKGD